MPEMQLLGKFIMLSTLRMHGVDMKVSDLILTDEHDTVSLNDSLKDATKKLLALPRGVLIVLAEENAPKGVISDAHILQAVADGMDCGSETCSSHMDTDIMHVNLEDEINSLVDQMTKRRPNAVVAVDENGVFVGYFSPNDYREALARNT